LIKHSFYWFFVFTDSFLMILNLLPTSFVKFFMACFRYYSLIPWPSLHHEILLNCIFPKRIILRYQSKTTFWLSNHIVSINCTTKCSSRPIISHYFNVFSHKSLIKCRTITTCSIKTTLTRAKHIYIVMKITKEVIASSSDP